MESDGVLTSFIRFRSALLIPTRAAFASATIAPRLVAALWLASGLPAQAQSLRDGVAAYNRQDYVRASSIFIPLAERGVAPAQTWLGFMFQTGRGVPQNYTEAAMWYRRAAEQGDSLAQYSLGLLYDKGQGVPQDEVAAYKWLNLAAARAPKGVRENYARLRNALASKMSRGQIAAGQWYALRWPEDSPF